MIVCRREAPFHELQRFLKNLRQPLYVVDDERRIVYLNDACAAWLGVEAADLLSRTCRYQSGDPDPLAAAADALCPPPEVFQGRPPADALCPPPEVFQGQRVKSLVAKSNTDEASNQRVADFIPLAGENGECAGVLALAQRTNRIAGSGARSDSAESARLHAAVQRFRQSLRGWYRLDRLAGESAAMARVRAQVKLAAKTGAAVLIVGPPGSGRQHVARTIHALSDAADGNLRAGFVQRIAGGVAAIDRWGAQRTLSAIQKRTADNNPARPTSTTCQPNCITNLPNGWPRSRKIYVCWPQRGNRWWNSPVAAISEPNSPSCLGRS